MSNAKSFFTMLALLATLLLAMTARAQDLSRPLLLIATPELHGAYGETVLLAVPTGNQRHVGFIINRVSPFTLAKLFPQHAPSKQVVDPVYFGGPVGLGSIVAFVRSPSAPVPGAQRVFDDLFVALSAPVVDRIIEQTPNAARYVSGHVDWAHAELQAEIDAGFWYTADPHAELLFSKQVDSLWGELVGRVPPEQLTPRGKGRRAARIAAGTVPTRSAT